MFLYLTLKWKKLFWITWWIFRFSRLCEHTVPVGCLLPCFQEPGLRWQLNEILELLTLQSWSSSLTFMRMPLWAKQPLHIHNNCYWRPPESGTRPLQPLPSLPVLRQKANKWKRGFNNGQSDKSLSPFVCGLQASSEPPSGHISVTDKTENLTHLYLVSHSTMALVTKPTLGLHYTNVRPHPGAAVKVSGRTKPRSMLLFILSISEQGLDETAGEGVFACAVLALHGLTHSVYSAASTPSFLLLWTVWCEIAFLLLQTAVSALIREQAQSILWGKWQRRWQPLQWKQSRGLISMAFLYLQLPPANLITSRPN